MNLSNPLWKFLASVCLKDLVLTIISLLHKLGYAWGVCGCVDAHSSHWCLERIQHSESKTQKYSVRSFPLLPHQIKSADSYILLSVINIFTGHFPFSTSSPTIVPSACCQSHPGKVSRIGREKRERDTSHFLPHPYVRFKAEIAPFPLSKRVQ